MAKATANKIKSDPIYEYVIFAKGDKLILNADSYRSFGDDDSLVDFFIGDDSIASFRNWDYIIRGKEVISS
jgi:hypothetical protein